MRRWLRCLLCLVLVLALLVQVSPIRARAVDPFTYVAAEKVIQGLLLGLGVSAGVSFADDFIEVCQDFIEVAKREYSFLSDDEKIRIWTGNPDIPYMVDESVIDALFGWMWDSGVVSTSTAAFGLSHTVSFDGTTDEYTSYSDLYTILPISLSYTLTRDNGTFSYVRAVYVASTMWFYYVNGVRTSRCYDKYGDYYVDHSKGTASSDSSVLDIPVSGCYDLGHFDVTEDTNILDLVGSIISSEFVLTTKDLTLAEVAPAGSTIAEGYSIWNSNAITVTDEDGTERLVYPITLTQAYEDSLAITQADVWAGIGSTYVESTTDTETGTGSGTVVVPEMGGFTLDLKEYFPFCIPYDIYDFLCCLNADPVAPVIDWQIPLPTGGTYPLTVDLSPFDSVASILRTLQLFVFCIGLAAKTRDLIKG